MPSSRFRSLVHKCTGVFACTSGAYHTYYSLLPLEQFPSGQPPWAYPCTMVDVDPAACFIFSMDQYDGESGVARIVLDPSVCIGPVMLTEAHVLSCAVVAAGGIRRTHMSTDSFLSLCDQTSPLNSTAGARRWLACLYGFALWDFRDFLARCSQAKRHRAWLPELNDFCENPDEWWVNATSFSCINMGNSRRTCNFFPGVGR